MQEGTATDWSNTRHIQAACTKDPPLDGECVCLNAPYACIHTCGSCDWVDQFPIQLKIVEETPAKKGITVSVHAHSKHSHVYI